MHASEAKEISDGHYDPNYDYLDDRVVDGILSDIIMAAQKGEYSIDYETTAGLSVGDLRYCKEKIDELDYQVIADYEKGVLHISW